MPEQKENFYINISEKEQSKELFELLETVNLLQHIIEIYPATTQLGTHGRPYRCITKYDNDSEHQNITKVCVAPSASFDTSNTKPTVEKPIELEEFNKIKDGEVKCKKNIYIFNKDNITYTVTFATDAKMPQVEITYDPEKTTFSKPLWIGDKVNEQNQNKDFTH